jgi:hypothetical protein
MLLLAERYDKKMLRNILLSFIPIRHPIGNMFVRFGLSHEQ